MKSDFILLDIEIKSDCFFLLLLFFNSCYETGAKIPDVKSTRSRRE